MSDEATDFLIVILEPTQTKTPMYVRQLQQHVTHSVAFETNLETIKQIVQLGNDVESSIQFLMVVHAKCLVYLAKLDGKMN